MKQKSNVMRTVVAGVTGAIVAGAAVAAAVVMSDKKNQKKVKYTVPMFSDSMLRSKNYGSHTQTAAPASL